MRATSSFFVLHLTCRATSRARQVTIRLTWWDHDFGATADCQISPVRLPLGKSHVTVMLNTTGSGGGNPLPPTCRLRIYRGQNIAAIKTAYRLEMLKDMKEIVRIYILCRCI